MTASPCFQFKALLCFSCASLLCAGECLILSMQFKDHKERRVMREVCIALSTWGLCHQDFLKPPLGTSGQATAGSPPCPQDSALHHQGLGFLLGCSNVASPLPDHLRTPQRLECCFGSGVKTFSRRKSLFIYFLNCLLWGAFFLK